MDKKLALVFGGSRGIGAASVAALRRDGFDVAYTYVSQTPADAAFAYRVGRCLGRRRVLAGGE